MGDNVHLVALDKYKSIAKFDSQYFTVAQEKQIESSQDFNKSNERDIGNKVSLYRLNDKEQQQIWKIAEERIQKIEAHKQNFSKNALDLYAKEFDKLKSQQSPKAQLNFGPSAPRDWVLSKEAQKNVKNRFDNQQKAIYQIAEQKVDKILENARDNHRGPAPDLQKEFQQNRGQEHQQQRG